uniref:Uncharacterized protein n=1 Tax=Lates calcarifer TaxID=8187 RepID=A0A4W6CS53_LATCA
DRFFWGKWEHAKPTNTLLQVTADKISCNTVVVFIYLCVCFPSPSQDSDYVIAERNFVTDDRSMLSFHKGDIIRLQVMDGLEKGYSYGCVVRKKVVFLEELKRDTQDFGECSQYQFISA